MINVSVIAPVYNTEKYLQRFVDSVIAQQDIDLEIILVDDGSSDLSPQICDDYVSKYSFIKVIHGNNRGPATAKNKGLEIAQGEYVALLDSDDKLESNMLAVMYRAARQHNADIVCCNYKQIDENNTISHTQCSHEVKVLDHHQGLVHQLKKDLIYTQSWTKLFRREMLDTFQIRHDDGLKTDEDFLFNIRCFIKSKCCVVVDECLYVYTHRQQSLAHDYFRHHIEQYIDNRIFRAKTIDELLQTEVSTIRKYGVVHNMMYYNELLGKVSLFPEFWKDERVRQIKRYNFQHLYLLLQHHRLCGYSFVGAWLLLLLPTSLYMQYRNRKSRN